MSKLHRTPLVKKKKADIVNFELLLDWEIKLEDGKNIEAPSFSHIERGEKILSELNILLRLQRKARPRAYAILNYINFIGGFDSLVSKSSLKAYKDYLDKKKGIGVNTKADAFGHCINFLEHLMSSEVIKKEGRLKNFKRIPSEPSPTFVEIATRDSFFLTRLALII
jgi:hypothetical protein